MEQLKEKCLEKTCFFFSFENHDADQPVLQLILISAVLVFAAQIIRFYM